MKVIKDAQARGLIPRGLGYGFIERYLEMAAGQTDAPAVYQVFTALAVLAAAIPVDVYMVGAGAQRITPNLYTVLIGRSVAERKSTVLNIAEAVLAASEVGERCLRPQDASPGGIVEALGGRPSTCLINDELSVFLTSTKSSYAEGATKLLTTAYDGKPLDRLIRKKEGVKSAKDYQVNFLGASSKRWFLTSVSPADVSGGWLARWVFVLGEREWFLDIEPDKAAGAQRMADVAAMGILLSNFHNRVPNGIVDMNAGAKQLYREFGQSTNERQMAATETQMGPLGRVQLIAQKFAMLLAADRTSFGQAVTPAEIVINEWDMHIGTQLANIHAASVVTILAEVNEGDVNRHKTIILEAIRARKGQAISMGDLSRECRLPLLNKPYIDRLQMLEIEGYIKKLMPMGASQPDLWVEVNQDHTLPTQVAAPQPSSPPPNLPQAPTTANMYQGAESSLQHSTPPSGPSGPSGGSAIAPNPATLYAPPAPTQAPMPPNAQGPSMAPFPMHLPGGTWSDEDDDESY